MSIIIKSEREIALMRQAGRIVAVVLAELKEKVRAGMTTGELDAIAARGIERLGGKSSFLGYRGYPASLCVSVNDEIVHGIPGERVLMEGDIVSLDLGAIFQGYQGDAAITVPVGEVSQQAKDLISATQGTLSAGINQARANNHLGDISAAIEQYALLQGFTVVREYTGHGIGRDMHEDPLVPNYGVPGTGPVLRQGMTLALEPMLNVGTWQTKVDSNQWTVRTGDGSLSAHFEHTIAITNGAAEVLTVR